MFYIFITLLFLPVLVFGLRAKPDRPKRILVIQRAKIGDVISSTPVFNRLRSHFPEAIIDALVAPLTASMLHANPRLSNVLVFSDADLSSWRGKVALVRRLRLARYDAVVCLNAGVVYPLICFWAGIPVRLAVAPNFSGRTYLYASQFWTATEAHRADQLIVETYARLLAKLGIEPAPPVKEVFTVDGGEAKAAGFLDGAPVHGWLGIGVSSGNKLKELGLAKLQEIVAGLLARHPDKGVVLIGSQTDLSLASQLCQDLPLDRVLNACGKFSLVELPALLARLDLYLGVDSGITHMADAVGKPIVSVAGPCNMGETRPLGQDVIIIQPRLACAPCSHMFKAPYQCRIGSLECIRSVSVGEVLAAADKLLREVEAGVAST